MLTERDAARINQPKTKPTDVSGYDLAAERRGRMLAALDAVADCCCRCMDNIATRRFGAAGVNMEDALPQITALRRYLIEDAR